MTAAFTKNPIPRSRRHQLVIQKLPDEVLIYDLETNKAFCLNPTAAFVWQSCDGHNSVGQIADLLSKKLKTPVEEVVVWFALKELERHKLLDGAVEAPPAVSAINRRQLIQTIGKASAVALPMIFAITAPMPAAAQSGCRQTFQSCGGSNGSCCSGNTCLSGSCCRNNGQACPNASYCCGGVCSNGICSSSGGGEIF